MRMAPARLVPRLDLADVLHGQIRALRLPDPVRELRPFADRRFRLDLAWVDRLLFAEVDGGEWMGGRHGRGAGMARDCEKWNRLTAEGWTGFRFTGSMVRSGEAVNFLEQVFGAAQ